MTQPGSPLPPDAAQAERPLTAHERQLIAARINAAHPEAMCQDCGGWTQNADGHRDDCVVRAKPERSSDAIMLLVWEQWAIKQGNDGAAALFRKAANALTELEVLSRAPMPLTPLKAPHAAD